MLRYVNQCIIIALRGVGIANNSLLYFDKGLGVPFERSNVLLRAVLTVNCTSLMLISQGVNS